VDSGVDGDVDGDAVPGVAVVALVFVAVVDVVIAGEEESVDDGDELRVLSTRVWTDTVRPLESTRNCFTMDTVWITTSGSVVVAAGCLWCK
jgi:hypothetical protein